MLSLIENLDARETKFRFTYIMQVGTKVVKGDKKLLIPAISIDF